MPGAVAKAQMVSSLTSDVHRAKIRFQRNWCPDSYRDGGLVDWWIGEVANW
ncbi:MAG: hypothetical protein IPK10_01730 [Bacteroidetes bacterium]|nr:hypothetical protein [Bacteroidota bacterium]